MIRESSIETCVWKWARDHGISTLKLGGNQSRGKADRLFMRNGVAAFCELKRKGKKAEPLQERFLAERRADGFHAQWFDSAPAAIRWLREVFNIS